jgi:hypothetical protein
VFALVDLGVSSSCCTSACGCTPPRRSASSSAHHRLPAQPALHFTAQGWKRRFAGFVALYATTVAINVGVNALALAVLPADAGALHGGLGDRPGHRARRSTS